ncbi:unnamed protein product [Caenorhabditis auriculariae]|uniref:DUF3456 domain-containing protein n=1 Tax=Caenorhabditis auriculariae TaxID=2777116 RepID=A0A8S1GWP1_9PELO|nr:unnamed protein product [Caenorhabditis auriculariae]
MTPNPMFLLKAHAHLSQAFADEINTDSEFNPTKCEICSIVSDELENALSRVYSKTSSNFIDAVDGFCNVMNQYKIHKEKKGVERFSKEQSKTLNTIKELKERGVQVELGMPFEMFEQPSAEITQIKQGCEGMLEQYEDQLENWFLRSGKDIKWMLEKPSERPRPRVFFGERPGAKPSMKMFWRFMLVFAHLRRRLLCHDAFRLCVGITP